MTGVIKDEVVRKLADETIIVDCCVISPEIFWCIGVKDMGEDFDNWSKFPPLHAIQYHIGYEGDPSGPWGWFCFEENNFKNPLCVHTDNNKEMILGDYNGEIYFRGLGSNKHWEENGISQRGIKALKNIHGTIYAAGLMRSVFRRDGKDQWTFISEALSQQTQATKDTINARGGKQLWTGFECIDGFDSHRDLYAAGGDGDVWHYDGEQWSAVDIPLPKMQIAEICCASDGFVYIVGRFGAILKGRGDQWHTVVHDFKYDFSDVVDYQGTIYIASAQRLFFIENDQLVMVQYQGNLVPANHGHLYVNHGLLMTAGRNSAAIYNGKEWKVLFGGAYLDEESSEYVLGKIMQYAIKTEE